MRAADLLPTRVLARTPAPAGSCLARRGFTIVELLVVIAIIAVLMGLLVVGLRGAIGTSRKMRELNFLRGIHTAWSQYATNYDECLLPGYLPEATLTAWNVTYRDSAGQTVPTNLAQTYPWRLAGYLGKEAYAAFVGYAEFESSDGEGQPSVDWPIDMTTVPAWMQPGLGTPRSAIALQPLASYNAYYIGGWYQENAGVSQPRFVDAAWQTEAGDQRRGSLVATRLAQIRRTAEVVVFATGTYRSAGVYRDTTAGEDQTVGCAWIAPSRLGTQSIWQPAMGTQQSVTVSMGEGAGSFGFLPQSGFSDTGVLQVDASQGVPIRRHNKLVGVIHADGSSESQSVGALMDMRMWIDSADRSEFQHADN